jgi:hypothetical protein
MMFEPATKTVYTAYCGHWGCSERITAPVFNDMIVLPTGWARWASFTGTPNYAFLCPTHLSRLLAAEQC